MTSANIRRDKNQTYRQVRVWNWRTVYKGSYQRAVFEQ